MVFGLNGAPVGMPAPSLLTMQANMGGFSRATPQSDDHKHNPSLLDGTSLCGCSSYVSPYDGNSHCCSRWVLASCLSCCGVGRLLTVLRSSRSSPPRRGIKGWGLLLTIVMFLLICGVKQFSEDFTVELSSSLIAERATDALLPMVQHKDATAVVRGELRGVLHDAIADVLEEAPQFHWMNETKNMKVRGEITAAIKKVVTKQLTIKAEYSLQSIQAALLMKTIESLESNFANVMVTFGVGIFFYACFLILSILSVAIIIISGFIARKYHLKWPCCQVVCSTCFCFPCFGVQLRNALELHGHRHQTHLQLQHQHQFV